MCPRRSCAPARPAYWSGWRASTITTPGAPSAARTSSSVARSGANTAGANAVGDGGVAARDAPVLERPLAEAAVHHVHLPVPEPLEDPGDIGGVDVPRVAGAVDRHR